MNNCLDIQPLPRIQHVGKQFPYLLSQDHSRSGVLSVTLSFLTTVSLDSPQRSKTSTFHQASCLLLLHHLPGSGLGYTVPTPTPSTTPLAMDTGQSPQCASGHSETFLGAMMSVEERPSAFLAASQGSRRKFTGSVNQSPSPLCFPPINSLQELYLLPSPSPFRSLVEH